MKAIKYYTAELKEKNKWNLSDAINVPRIQSQCSVEVKVGLGFSNIDLNFMGLDHGLWCPNKVARRVPSCLERHEDSI